MKFLDQAKIYVRSGDGGDGVIAFRREKYIEFGGPDGGNGRQMVPRVSGEADAPPLQLSLVQLPTRSLCFVVLLRFVSLTNSLEMFKDKRSVVLQECKLTGSTSSCQHRNKNS